MADTKDIVPSNKGIAVSTGSKVKIGGPKGGLHARIQQAAFVKEVLPSVDPAKMPNRLVLILDCSGSMQSGGGHGESDTSKIELLRSAVIDFIDRADYGTTSIAIESFPKGSNLPLTCDRTILWLTANGLSAGGGTPMAGAMHDALIHKPTRGLLISDGQADSPQSAIDCAENWMGISRLQNDQEDILTPIDTVHIGSSTSGEETLKEIARITGGLFVKFRDVKQFATAFRFLLPKTRANAAKLFLTAGANEVSE